MSKEDMYSCYKAFFVLKKNKLNVILKWISVLLDLTLVVLFFVLIGLRKTEGLVQLGIITFALCAITYVLYFNQGIVHIVANRNYKKAHLDQSNKVIVEISDNIYNETLMNGNEVVAKSAYSMYEITKLEEDDYNIYIMFGRRAASIIKKSSSDDDTLKRLGLMLAGYRDRHAARNKVIKEPAQENVEDSGKSVASDKEEQSNNAIEDAAPKVEPKQAEGTPTDEIKLAVQEEMILEEPQLEGQMTMDDIDNQGTEDKE